MRPSPPGVLGVVSSAALAVLSKFTCALCVAAYAGVLSSLGIGFAGTDRGLTVITFLLLLINLASIGWSVPRHGNFGPVALAGVGSVVVLAGRHALSAPPLYAGAIMITAGSIWNVWLSRRLRRPLVRVLARDHTAPST